MKPPTNSDEFETELQQWGFDSWQDEHPGAVALIKQRIAERRAIVISDRQITGTALARYFRLLDIARRQLVNKFSREELALMLDARPQPVWAGELEVTPFDVICSVLYESSLLEDKSNTQQPALKLLATKLFRLKPLQRAALLDILECAWRDTKVGPLEYAWQVLGDDSASPVVQLQ